MFGLRYHVASLAAVFVALALGILLGVAVSGKLTDVGEDAELQNLRGRQRATQAGAGRRPCAGRGRDRAGRRAPSELFARGLPDAHGRAPGGQERRGRLSRARRTASVRADVEGALADADGGAPARVVALDVPVDPAELGAALEGDELLAGYADDEGDFSDLGRDLGRELVEGDETLWTCSRRSSSRSSRARPRTRWTRWSSHAPGSRRRRATERGRRRRGDLVADGRPRQRARRLRSPGRRRRRRPTIPPPSWTATATRGSRASTTSTTPAGRLALALLLAGGEPGHYGFGEGATDGVIPPIEPVTDRG